jgi:hypothetical protein
MKKIIFVQEKFLILFQKQCGDQIKPSSIPSCSASSFIQQTTQQVENICSMENTTAQQMLQVIVK